MGSSTRLGQVEFPDPDIKTTIVCMRIRKYADGRQEEKKEVERVLVWTKKDEKWVISSLPEP